MKPYLRKLSSILHLAHDLFDVIISNPQDLDVLTYDAASKKWKNHLNAGGSIEIKEADGVPDATGVSKIVVSNGSLTNNGGGQVTLVTGGIEVKEVDGAPDVTGVSKVVVSNGTLTDNGSGQVTLVTGGGSLEVKEADGSPDVSGVSLISVTNGKLTDNGGGSISLDLSGGGTTVKYPSLKPATPTDDFDATSLAGGWSAHSNGGTFAVGNCMTQGVEWNGSALEMQFSQQQGTIYKTHADTDFDFTFGGCFADIFGSLMIGIAAVNTSGTGVAVVAYTDNGCYLATYTTHNYASFSDSWGGSGLQGGSQGRSGTYWFRLKRVSGVWTGYVSRSGRAWDKVFATRNDSIVVAQLHFGLLYNSGSLYSGRVCADYFQLDA